MPRYPRPIHQVLGEVSETEYIAILTEVHTISGIMLVGMATLEKSAIPNEKETLEKVYGTSLDVYLFVWITILDIY